MKALMISILWFREESSQEEYQPLNEIETFSKRQKALIKNSRIYDK